MLDGLVAISAPVAVWLGRHRGGISLGGLRSITPDVAAGLAAGCEDLLLNGLQSIDAQTAAALASSPRALHMDGIEHLSDAACAALANHRGDLRLSGLSSLSEAAAHWLSCHRGRLTLDGLTSLRLEVARALRGHRGGLSLRGLSDMSVDVAHALASTGGDLHLDGLTSISLQAARALGNRDGWLSLNGIPSLDADTCRALVQRTEWLSLKGLTSASDEVAAILKQRGLVERKGGPAAGAEKSHVSSPEAASPTVVSAPILGVAIIGAGFSGIAMAIGLLKQGRQDFAVFEKADSLGGTWRDNTYPGCACDIPSHLYSYSFAPADGWSKRYASQPEILAYLQRVAASHDIERFIRPGTAIIGAEWDETARLWTLSAADGTRFRARTVVAGLGGIHIPHVPSLPGLERFAGPMFHTARWRHDIDLSGRRVAVIGSGASGIQVVPELAKQVGRLTVFQRTASWVLPRHDRPSSRLATWAVRSLPGLGRLLRLSEFWAAELRAIPLFWNPKLLVHGQRKTKAFLKRCIKERQIRRKLIPQYTMGCKRILSSNEYYPAMTRSNVDLAIEPIAEIRPWSVLTTDGVERAVDAIVLATGFKPFNITDGISVTGRDGLDLREAWRSGPEAYRGVAVSSFPNFFLLMGPNTALAHNSIIVMIEAQVKYILQCLGWLDDGRLEAVEVRDDVQRQFNAGLSERFAKSVWAERTEGVTRGRPLVSCMTWYRGPSGKNHVLWPGTAMSYCAAMRRADINDFAHDCGARSSASSDAIGSGRAVA
jgi:cation diffusion facilitator CzcD-associated flavoprotein CzcO